MSKILITGGTGFIGYHLAKRLAEGNNEIILVSRPRDKKDYDLEILLKKPNVKFIEVDLTDKKSYSKIGGGYDYIYHLAGLKSLRDFSEKPHEILRIGLESTLNLLDWFRLKNNKSQAKILYASTSDVYAGIPSISALPLPTPEKIPLIIPDPYEPRWSYAGQKIIGELLFIHYSKAYNFRMVIVRPNNIYGPRSGQDPMIPKMIARIQKHMDPFPLISPEENRASLYIDDAVSAMQSAMESVKTDGQTYNIGENKETTVKELLEIMFKIAEWHPEKFDMKESPGDASKHSLPDISKLKNDTGWEPEVGLEVGLRKTIEWYSKTNQ